MKKRQKIIVVISCLAVIVSVLAVNCFAWMGQSGVTTPSAISTVTAGFYNQDVDWFLQNEGITIADKRVDIPFDSSNLVNAGTSDKIAYGETYLQFGPSYSDNLVLWSQIESYYSADGEGSTNSVMFLELFGTMSSIEPHASDLSLDYAPFVVGGDFDTLLYDSVILHEYVGEHGGDYLMAGELRFFVPIIEYYEEKAEIVKLSVEVVVEGTPYAGQSFMLMEQDTLTVRINGVSRTYQNETIVDSVKIAIGSFYGGRDSVLSYDALYRDAYCYDAFFSFYGDFIGFEIDAQTPELTNGEGLLEIPTQVTIEEVIQVVEEVQVEPFEWIMQAANGVLNVSLFGSITIGHLLMIAIAVPALLAILRAIAGG